MNKSVLWLIKTYFFFVFLDVLVAVAVVVAKAHSTRIRLFLNPQIFFADSKITMSTRSVFKSNLPVHTYSGFTLC